MSSATWTTPSSVAGSTEVALRGAGITVETIVLQGDTVVPDEGRIMHTLLIAPDHGHFTRPRFTIAKLRLLLGL